MPRKTWVWVSENASAMTGSDRLISSGIIPHRPVPYAICDVAVAVAAKELQSGFIDNQTRTTILQQPLRSRKPVKIRRGRATVIGHISWPGVRPASRLAAFQWDA